MGAVLSGQRLSGGGVSIAALQALDATELGAFLSQFGPYGRPIIQIDSTFGGNFAVANDWSPAGYNTSASAPPQWINVRTQDGGTQSINGLVGGSDGKIVIISKWVAAGDTTNGNRGLSIAAEAGGSTAANRFCMNAAFSLSFGSNDSGTVGVFRYYGARSRWILVGTSNP